MSDRPDLPAAHPDPHQALPGPHPHEADDVRYWAGSQKNLPEGVEPYRAGPETGTDPETAPPAPPAD